MRILVAEDDEGVRELVVGILETEGHEVCAAGDGAEALLLLVEDGARGGAGFDLLFTDILMPKLNGFELARRATTLQPGLAVLYASGYTGSALPDGHPPVPGRWLRKPFRPSTLLAEIERCAAVARADRGGGANR